MRSRSLGRAVLGAVLAAVLLLPQAALAAGWPAFDASAFEQAKKEGKTVFVHVHAAW